MPTIDVVYYSEADGSSPVLDWLQDRRSVPRVAAVKLLERIERLELLGHELRRPESDLLRDGIHELRVKHMRVNYRLLYFFDHWQASGEPERVAVIAHGLTKEREVPDRDIEIAIRRMKSFQADRAAHTFVERE
jgi:phage-related protein